MTTVGTGVNTFSGSDITLTCGSNNTGNADEFPDEVALQISDHDWVFITMNLQLELRAFLHIRVALIIVVNFIDGLDCGLKSFDVIRRLTFEC